MIIASLPKKDGGASRDRTDDLKLAKLALSQLSYGPVVQPYGRVRSRTECCDWRARKMVGLGRLELPTSRLSSARSNQLSYRPESTTLISVHHHERDTKTALRRRAPNQPEPDRTF